MDAEKRGVFIKRYVNSTELTDERRNTLVEKTVIHESVKDREGTGEKEVEIYYLAPVRMLGIPCTAKVTFLTRVQAISAVSGKRESRVVQKLSNKVDCREADQKASSVMATVTISS